MLEKIAKQKTERLMWSIEPEKQKIQQESEYANSEIYLRLLEPTQENLSV